MRRPPPRLVRCTSTVFVSTVLALAALLVTAAASASAASPPLSWHLPARLGRVSLAADSCPTASLCVAVGGRSVFVTTRPAHRGARWTRTQLPAHGLSGVSCASPSLCVAVDSTGEAFASTRPTAGSSAWHVASVDPGHHLYAVACPATALCIAVGDDGHAVTSTDPAAAAPTWTVATVDPPFSCPPNSEGTISCTQVGSGPPLNCSDAGCPVTLTAVSCPSPAFCAAVDNAGDAVTSTEPAGGAAAWRGSAVEPANDCTPHTWCITGLTGIACPTPQFCAAFDDVGNEASSTAPTSAAPWVITGFTGGGPVPFGGVSCPLPSRCVAVDEAGNADLTTHPTRTSSRWAMTPIETANNATLTAVSCVSVLFCVAVDTRGAAIVGTLSKARIIGALSALQGGLRHHAIGDLLAGSGLPLPFGPPSPGRLALVLRVAGPGGSTGTSLGVINESFKDTTPAAAPLALTSAGRRILGGASLLHVLVRAIFTPSGSDPVTTTSTFTLRH